MLDWLIVGGGIHGTHHSLALLAAGVSRERLRVLDPWPQPLQRWEECTERCGMMFLRSAGVHHLDLSPRSLDQFAHSREGRALCRFAWPYQRPALVLFRAHCAAVIARHRLDELRLPGRALRLRRRGGGFVVETEAGPLPARRVLLALGLSEQPAWPHWARSLQAAGADVLHLFDPVAAPLRELPPRLVIVGGGISAAQAAVALGQRRPGAVTLLSRHAPRIHQLDSDPGWVGPLYLAGFSRLRDPVARRRAIVAARHRGSMPRDVHAELQRAIGEGLVRWHVGAVQAVSFGAGGIILQLGDGSEVSADRVVLATGFEAGRPGGAFIDDAIEALGLRCAPCGYPIVDEALRWAEGLHVTGPLAELEIGPVSRNIAGARLASRRLAAIV